jgi:hypothetical protein
MLFGELSMINKWSEFNINNLENSFRGVVLNSIYEKVCLVWNKIGPLNSNLIFNFRTFQDIKPHE